MKKIKLILVFYTLILSLVLTSSAEAKPNHLPVFDDKVVIGGTFTLRSEERLDGSLVIIGGTVSLREGSTVTGEVVLIGGNLSVEGSIQKDLVALGGVLELGATAVVRGDLIAPGTVLRRDEGATIGGDLITDGSPIDIDIPEIPEFTTPPTVRVPEIGSSSFLDGIVRTLSPVMQVFRFMFSSFAFSAVAVLFMLVLPDHTLRASRTVLADPVVSGGFGLLTLAAAIPVSFILTVLIVPIPFALLLVFAIAIGIFMGWIAVGHELGRRLGASFNQTWTPPIEAGIGTFALTFVIGSFNLALWGGLGDVLRFAIASIGLGAVLLTRFGSREYVPSSRGGGAAAGDAVAAIEVSSETVEAEEEKPKLKTKAAVKVKSKTKSKTSRKPPGKTGAKEDNEE